MIAIPVFVVERRTFVCENGRDSHAGGIVPVPKRKSESGVIDHLPQDFLIEIEIPAVPRKEYPGAVNVKLVVSEALLIIAATIAVGTVDIGLLHETARIIRWKVLHAPHGFLVLGYVIISDQMSSWSNSKG